MPRLVRAFAASKQEVKMKMTTETKNAKPLSLSDSPQYVHLLDLGIQ